MAESTIKAIKSGWELLWTNPNPSSAFAAQTISLDLSRYDLIMILSKKNISSQELILPTIIHKENNIKGVLLHIFFSDVRDWPHNVACRGISTINDTSIVFEDTRQKATNATTAATIDNEMIIPYYIYGQSL